MSANKPRISAKRLEMLCNPDAPRDLSCWEVEHLIYDLRDARKQLAAAKLDGERLNQLQSLIDEMIRVIRSEYPGTADSYQREFDRIAARQKEGTSV